MNVYYDTEFLEGTQKKWFGGKTKPTIDLISIGLVTEDGQEYYAISKDFNLKEAWNRFQIETDDKTGLEWKVYWIRDNVLRPIYYNLIGKDIGFHDYDSFFTFKSFKSLIEKHGKSNSQIANEIIEFFYGKLDNKDGLSAVEMSRKFDVDEGPTLYGYYSAYDHVVFCWLFGRMIDLPNGFPMYTRDLNQIWDEFEETNKVVTLKDGKYHSTNVKRLSTSYPKQDPSKAHNALEDARWNKQLHEFIRSL